jgi:hypothetical protein
MDAALALRWRNALPAMASGLAQQWPDEVVGAFDNDDQSTSALVFDICAKAMPLRIGKVDGRLLHGEQLRVFSALSRTDFNGEFHFTSPSN